MKKKGTIRTCALVAGGFLALTAIPLSACGKGSKRDDIVIMAEEFSGLFNPFYATSGSDMEVVGLTQLSMLTTDSDGNLTAGRNEATAVLDYEIGEDNSGNAVYTFVLKNGLKFSDGKPLTMNDVMFNMYEYLDPVYTGSSTMYSVKIKGLAKYRTQQDLAGDASDDLQDSDSREAYQKAGIRRSELLDVFRQEKFHETGTGSSATYYAEPDQMRAAIREWNVSSSYKGVVPMKEGETDYNKKLLDDYELALTTFKKELNSDFSAARESYDLKADPYKKWAKEMESDIFKFFLYENYITPKYGLGSDNKEDKSNIISFEYGVDLAKFKTQDDAVNKVFNDKINSNFDQVITSWGTAGEIMTAFSAEAKEMILNNRKDGDGLRYPNVEGIVSLGHTTNETSVTIKSEVSGENVTYSVAQEHNADGTPANANQENGPFDILRITLDGKDPKAKYNFSFSVAPAHYYSGLSIDIKANKFGVEYGSASFQSKTIQSQRNVEVPLGAGPYKASNASNGDNPAGNEFWRNNYVFYKANSHFMFPVKTEKLRYQYVSSSNALDKLANREIDFVTPQFTKENADRLVKMAKKGFETLDAWQLGYGYVGINAGKVPSLNARKAIMSAMQARLALTYYQTGMCEVIDWPMSNQSWAYPKDAAGTSKPNGHEYTQWSDPDEVYDSALDKINKYTKAAIDEDGVTSLKFKFTIAGASITEHPTYAVFKQAVELLQKANEKYNFSVKWDVEVKADSQALTKLSTGSLEVWAAAWGSTIDPDMYQVYHKNSTATSVYAWGYREILADQGTYWREYDIIANKLSPLIDEARKIEDQKARTKMYEEAMGYVLDLAVEMPIYQRKNLYAYDANRIGGINKQVNPFTSPLEKIWNIELI